MLSQLNIDDHVSVNVGGYGHYYDRTSESESVYPSAVLYHDDHVTTRPAGDRADSHTNGHWHAVGNHEAQADGLTLAGQHTLILSSESESASLQLPVSSRCQPRPACQRVRMKLQFSSVLQSLITTTCIRHSSLSLRLSTCAGGGTLST